MMEMVKMMMADLSREERVEGSACKRLCWMLNTWKFEFGETQSTSKKLIFGSCKDSLKTLPKMRSQPNVDYLEVGE